MTVGAADPHPAPWKSFLGTAAAFLVGALLLIAAWAKAVHPAAFVEQIRLEGLDFFGLALPVALVALALEVGLGLALVLGLRRRWVLFPAAALVLFFLFLTGRTYWRATQGVVDPAAACGCFGNLVERTPAEAFWQDLLLLGVPMLLAFVGLPRRPGTPRLRLAVVVAVTAAALVFAWKAPDLPLDDLATRLRPGVEVADVCAGAEDERICLDAVVAGLETGRHLVVLSGLDEPDFLEAMGDLNARAVDGESPLWVVTAAPPEALGAFRWTAAPAFEVREAPEALLRPLYRTLPRSFEVEDGKVVATFPGLPPDGAADSPMRQSAS